MTDQMHDIDAVMFLVQVFATFLMTGIIWFVQLVHYPLLRRIPRSRFVAYERTHVLLTAFVVGPLIVLETAAVSYSLWRTPPWMQQEVAVLGAVLLAIILLSTIFFQGPQHRKLQQGFNPGVYRRLLCTNWIRCYGWSFRSILLLFSMLRVLALE
jgi:hypothetical protein